MTDAESESIDTIITNIFDETGNDLNGIGMRADSRDIERNNKTYYCTFDNPSGNKRAVLGVRRVLLLAPVLIWRLAASKNQPRG